jgi:hypothetical protein
MRVSYGILVVTTPSETRRDAMPANSEEIVQQVREEFEALLTFVLEASPQTVPDADTMERGLFRQLFAMGCLLLRLYFRQQDRLLAPETVSSKAGKELPFHSQKQRTYLSIFGPVVFSRRYYYQFGEGYAPLDATLNLPESGASDMLREWRERLGMYSSYQKVTRDLAEFLGHHASTRQIQHDIAEDAEAVEGFYAQVPAPLPDPTATILVVQADGKGVPMRQITEAAEKVRKGKGEKTSCKKEAIVTSVYSLAPAPRTPEEVVASLFSPKKDMPAPPKRGAPTNKRLFATLDGKEEALLRTAPQAGKQEGEHIGGRVALTDGAQALQQRVLSVFVGFVLVLDCIHAIEYLWKAANALLGETSEARTDWVKTRALWMLSGQTQELIADLRQIAGCADTTPSVRKTLESVAQYYERNQEYMRYDAYLAAGWPIGTGVIEGACRHLVKDRCELSGMRWSQEGAESLLQLRCVAENGDWNAFHTYRRAQRRLTLYGQTIQNEEPVELRWAA